MRSNPRTTPPVPPKAPSKRAPRRSREDFELFAKFVDISSALLARVTPEASLPDLMATAGEQVRNATGAEIAVIGLQDRSEWRWHTSGLHNDQPIHEPVADPSLLEKINPARGLHSLTPTVAEALVGPDLAHHAKVRLWHCLPLATPTELVGVILLGMPHNREFPSEDKHFIDAFGSRAAIAFTFHFQRHALERAVRARDQVLSVVAHDLKNPLNVIAITANTLLQRFSDSVARRPIERVIRSAQRAERIIRDLVEVDAIEMGRLFLDKRPVDPTTVILAALDSQQTLAADRSLILSSDLSPDAPIIEADEERLHGVLENLIGNAIKFTSPGGQITVGASTRGEDLLIWVKDTGAGITPDHMPHIFDRFYQASKSERHGTGLGLTICRGIVEAHNGRIWAESVPGEGTTMYFTIPFKPARGKKQPAKSVNILLVDDRPENLLALEAILDRPEYHLIKATSGEEALSVALRETFAVALIDVAMPEMNGLEVAVHLKALERSRDIPIIFITAFGNDPEEIHRAYSAGGADYLVKPLDPEIVRKKVAVFVDLSRRRSGADSSRPRV